MGADLLRAVGTTEDLPSRFHPVADHAPAAILAGWCHGVDGALEAVVGARDPPEADLHRALVVIAAHVTAWHIRSSYTLGGAALMSASADRRSRSTATSPMET